MHVLVVGNGMVGSRFVEELLDRRADVRVTVLGAERHEPYNRVLLSEVVAGRVEPSSLGLVAAPEERATVRTGVAAVAVDRASRTVTTTDGGVVGYDVLVLATGARARIPDLPGLVERPAGAHPLRTLDDASAIVGAAVPGAAAVVLGAGVLGLEVACGLADRGLAVTLVHAGGHLMDRQLDEPASHAVEHGLRRRGIAVRTGRLPERVLVRDGRVAGLAFAADEVLPAELMVLATGTVPETGLAVGAGLAVGRGIVVDADGRTDDPAVYAIGDCAQPPEGSTGLIAQGWDQARRLATVLAEQRGPVDTAGPARGRTTPADPSARPAPTDVVRVKAHGIEVVTMGTPSLAAGRPAHRAVRLSDPSTGRHVEVVVAGGVVVAATCVGAGPVAADLTAAYTRRTPVPADPAQLLLRPVRGAGAEPEPSVTLMPDRATVCRCNGVTKGELTRSWRDGARSLAEVVRATRATTGCGGCTDAVCGLLEWLADSAGEAAPLPVGAVADRAG